MAIDWHTLRLIDGLRIAVSSTVDAASQDIITAWSQAWTEVATEWDAALGDLVAASKDGQWPSRRQVLRAERARRALAITREALDDLAGKLPIRVLQDVPRLTRDAVEWQARLVAAQFPPQAGTTAEIMATFARVDPAALNTIVTRATEQVTAMSLPISAQAEAVMKSVLIRGIAVGENPRTAAAEMLRRLGGAFDGGRNRALVIARTEMLDAHRAASYAQDQTSSDVLAGWVWTCQLDNRTCVSCLAQHGQLHPLEEPGPFDHQQGRCARVPKTKSWRELGFNIEEPADMLPDSRTWFEGLPQEQQVTVMGVQRLRMLQAGKISWGDLSTKRLTPGWRDSYAPTPLRDLAA